MNSCFCAIRLIKSGIYGLQSLCQSLKSFFCIHNTGKGQHISRRFHFHLQPVFFPQDPVKDRAFCTCSGTGYQDLRQVQIKNIPLTPDLFSRQIKVFHLPQFSSALFQPENISVKSLFPFFFQITETGGHRSHKYIGRAAGLIDSQKTLQSFPGHQVRLPVDHRSLSQGG